MDGQEMTGLRARVRKVLLEREREEPEPIHEIAQYRSDNRLCCPGAFPLFESVCSDSGVGNHQAVLGQAGTRARLHPECWPAWHLPRTREASAALSSMDIRA
jgi:hypothetical protein